MKFQWAGLLNCRATAYGVAVFPPERELIRRAAWVFLARRDQECALLLLAGGLFLCDTAAMTI